MSVSILGGSRLAAAVSLAAMMTACSGEGPEPVSDLPESRNQPHVVGGAPASSSELHSTVAIWWHESKSFGCTGTLVAPKVVVTAAHCVAVEDYNYKVVGFEAPDNIGIVAGVLDATAPPAEAIYPVAKVVAHPKYGDFGQVDADGLGRDEDIAVLVLAQPVTVQPPAPVIDLAMVDDVLKPDTPIVVSGYGVSNESTNAEGVLNIASTPYQRRNDAEFLAGRPGMPDSCYGDSGGPAYVDVGGVLHLVGVTSRGSGGACGSGGIYTFVPGYDEFLKQAAGGLYPPSPPPKQPDPTPDPGTDPGTDPTPVTPSPTPGGSETPTRRASESQGSCALAPRAPASGGSLAWLALVLVAGFRRRTAASFEDGD